MGTVIEYIQENKVDICCGDRKPEGFFGIDIVPGKEVDLVADLNDPVPWQAFSKENNTIYMLKENSVEHLRAYDALEHLHCPIKQMSEIWRVCKDGARVEIFVPSTDGRGAFQDPTHVSFWNINSFMYYCVDFPEYLALNQKYGFQGAFKITNISHQGEPNFHTVPMGGGVIHVFANLKVIKGNNRTS